MSKIHARSDLIRRYTRSLVIRFGARASVVAAAQRDQARTIDRSVHQTWAEIYAALTEAHQH